MNHPDGLSRGQSGTEYRTVPEHRIVRLLMLGGFAYAPDTPRALAAVEDALRAWRALGLGVREARDGGRHYDPVELVNFFKINGLAGRDSFWSEHWVPTGRRLVADLAGTTRFRVDFSRSFPAPGGRLRMPMPLPGPFLRDLDAVTPHGDAARITRGRLELRSLATGAVTLQAKLGFEALPFRADRDAPPLAPTAAALYLRPQEGLIVVSPRVAALARRLAPPGTAPPRAVTAFWNYLIAEFMSGAVHYDQVDAATPGDAVLDTGIFDCQLGSALLAALCRARGIPARLMSGYLLYRRAPTNHYWAEIFLPDTGWTPFDLLSWDLSCGGRDDGWRNRFFGALDPRMTTQIMPLDFTGASGAAVPRAWHILQSATADGVAIDMVDLAGQTIYCDAVSVTAAGSAP